MVDDKNLHGSLGGLELKAKLLLERGEDGGAGCVGHGRRLLLRGGRWSCAVVRRPLEINGIPAIDASLIENIAAKYFGQLLCEGCNGVPTLHNEMSALRGYGVAVLLRFCKFWAALGDDESVDGKLSRLLMDGEFEAVGEERLQHLLLLQPALVGGEVLHPVTDGGIGLRLDVELVRINGGTGDC